MQNNHKFVNLSTYERCSSDQFCNPPLHLLQHVPVFCMLRTPELDTLLEVRSHQSGRITSCDLLPMLFLMQAFILLSGLQAHLNSSCPIFHPPAYPNIGTISCPDQDAAFILGLVEPHEIHYTRFFQVPLGVLP